MQQYQEQLSALMTQIPDDVARMAHEQQLGSPQASYMIFELRKGWRWTFWFFLSAMFLFLLWFILFFFTINYFLLNSFFLWSLIPLVGVYVLFMVGLIAISRTRRTCALYPCDGGLILRQTSKKFRVIRWEEIEMIQQTASRILFMGIRSSNLYTLHCHDGGTLTFSGQPRLIKQLAPVFEDQFTRRRLPFQLADYQAGRTLHFGPVRIDRNGVAVGEKMLPWEQVADISLLKGRRLIIYKMGEQQEVWLSLPAFKIDNLSILLALFKRIRSGQTDQEAGLQAISTTYGVGTTIVSSKRNRIDPLSEGLATLADEHQLGERRLDQQLGRKLLTSWARIITMSIIGITLLAGNVIFFFFSLFSNEAPIGSLVRYISSLNPFASYGTVFGLLLVITSIVHLRQINNHTYTFERGLILKRGKLAPAVVRWEEIQDVWRNPGIRLTRNSQATLPIHAYAYKFQLRDGNTYTLNRFNMRMDTLSKLIQEQVVPLQLPIAIDAYQTGQTLAFGEVRVNQQGITIGERSLPWPQVKSVTLQENKLAVFDITQRKPWGSVKAKKIPNLFLLFELADYARNGAKRPK